MHNGDIYGMGSDRQGLDVINRDIILRFLAIWHGVYRGCTSVNGDTNVRANMHANGGIDGDSRPCRINCMVRISIVASSL